MKRDELVTFLARVVRDRLITELQAVDLLKKFDAGILPDIELPMAPEELITGLSKQKIDEAIS